MDKLGFEPWSATLKADALTTRPMRRSATVHNIATCAGIFPGLSHTSDFKIGTPVATLPGTWRYRVSAGTGWPRVSIL